MLICSRLLNRYNQDRVSEYIVSYILMETHPSLNHLKSR
uniref:Uncharacterized protein n=1 Tax=Podoviridae sp. ctG4L18 TaxID=2825234 RepID=A0A8S5UP75_9CAUD|nr:MAG TPA: hypothetical protein [Podoviridae sp. ctG4L18]